MAERPAHQPEDGGSNPTLSLHSLRVRQCNVEDIKPVIERVHYSHSIFGVTTDFCYAVEDHRLSPPVGGAIFGKPAAYNVAKKYGAEGLTELRRFVLIDECPRNSESRLIAFMLRDLKRKGVKRVLSYADPAQGHGGTIYKALGFKYVGLTAKRKHVMWKGKKYPDRNVHQTKFPFHLELRAALESGAATRVEVAGKHIYLKELS
jgi:hypothetical protein